MGNDDVLNIINKAKQEESVKLSLSKMGLNAIPPGHFLPHVQILYLQENNIESLDNLDGFPNLETLILYSNRIKAIKGLDSLTRLKRLSLANNEIKTITNLEKLVSLERLDLSGNQISRISNLKALYKLQRLDLRNNRIRRLSKSVLGLNLPLYWEQADGPGIYLEGNPLASPPPEVVRQGNDVVKEFFKEEKRRVLNEVKVILVGDGGAGKTSLINRLLGQPFNEQEEKTHGINIQKQKVGINGFGITVRYWDFGGQEVMHATHQFFLSHRSIYVLVLDARNDHKPEYWLKHIESFGGNSPVVVVLNKMDENPGFQLPESFLRVKYPHIKGFFMLSCKTGEGLETFLQKLKQEIWDLDLRKSDFPESWKLVKDYFDGMKEDYVSFMRFREVCKKMGITRPEVQEDLLKILHDLGILLHYEKLKFHNIYVINPSWITNAVYRIINSSLVAENKGFFRANDLNHIFYGPDNNEAEQEELFEGEKIPFILDLMRHFQICFSIDEEQYIIPDLLAVDHEPYQISHDQGLSLIMKYPDFLPKSVIPRLMSKLNRYIFQNRMWKTGMVLKEDIFTQSVANIVADPEAHQIRIEIAGDGDKRVLLSIIREELRTINSSFKTLKTSEWIVLPDKGNGEEVKVEYEEILGLELVGIEKYYNWKTRKWYTVKSLLNGIESPIKRNNDGKIIKIFIAYSRADLEFAEELRKALMPLKHHPDLNIDLWDESMMMAGSNLSKEKAQNLREAYCVLCLISSDFISSEFYHGKEFQSVLEAHKRKEKIIIPIMIRACAWEALEISHIKGLPEEWVSASKNDKAWTAVANGLKDLLTSIGG